MGPLFLAGFGGAGSLFPVGFAGGAGSLFLVGFAGRAHRSSAVLPSSAVIGCTGADPEPLAVTLASLCFDEGDPAPCTELL